MFTHSILLVNRMVLQEGHRKYRVIFIDGPTRDTWLIDINDDSWAFPRDTRDLQAQVDSGEIKPVEDPYGSQPILEDDSPSLIVQTRRYDLIKAFVQDIRKLLTKRERSLLIASIPTTRQTATFLLKQFLKRGMTQVALRPDFSKCGHWEDDAANQNASGIARRNPKPDAKKVGAPRTISLGIGINVTEEVRRHLHLGADLWLSSNTITLRRAIDFVVETYYSNKILEPTGEDVFQAEHDLKPTERQLSYFIKNEYPEEYIRRKRNGTKHYDLQERSVIGWADCSVQGPGDEFQVDATIANVPLVSQFDRRRIVGYPVIYFMVDVFSRLITGVSVGFEGPSWAGAMMVLINMVTPKVEFCRRYGINITEDQWPSFHAPKHILADRAELMSVRLGNDIIKNLGIDILNVTAGRPDLKALVERRFGIIKAEFGDFAPGFVKEKFKNAPRVKDARLNATINLFEFTQMLIHAVLVHNITPIRDFTPPPEMVTEGLTPAPLDLWNWGIVNRSGSLDQLSIDKTIINVMHRDKARVTSKGIKYRGIYYLSPSSIKDEWYARARRHEWDVTIGMVPSNMENILLLDPNLPRGFEVCELAKTSMDYTFKSLFEIEELQEANKQNIAGANNDRQSERITHESAIRKMLEYAKEEKRQLDQADTRSKSEKTKHIRDARAQEKASLQKQNSILTALGIKTDTSAPLTQEFPSHTPHEEDIGRRLKEERERRKKDKGHGNR